MAMNLAADHDLTVKDVQQLANADAVAALFAALGYDTGQRLSQSPAAMGITTESLRRKIRRIERIADQEQGAFQVYLVELDSVTIAATHGLTRALRDRAGNYLLVLTADYEVIDFVLLERELPRTPSTRISTPQVAVRPRVLTVMRRNPGTVALRVLRRFCYSEADPDAQFDKLLSAYGVAEWSEPNFNNRALFADYFLNERLPAMPEWAEDPRPSYLRLHKLYAAARERFRGLDEATIRRELIEPALQTLGFACKVAKAGIEAPDYLLSLGDDSTPTVAALAYAWDRQLDAKDETRDTHRPADNPGARVVSVLGAGPAPWVIVTNGKIWRLYAAAAHSRSTNYYEIDLEETLAVTDPGEAFRYFWLLFRAAAFTTRETFVQGEPRALSFVDGLLQESAEYARRLGNRLKERVFEEVFPELAKGFIAQVRHLDGAVADLSQARLDEVFRGTLTLLYRILFLLYAEARDLLPAREVRGYWEKSLSRLKTQVAEAGGSIEDEAPKRLAKAFSANPVDTRLYDRLLDLARTADRGDSGVNTPVYNGGLFLTEVQPDDYSPEAEAARFLLKYKVPDRFLAQALDLLARDVDEKRGDLAPIDYKSLGVRQLGSIYEGLLEFRLRLAPEKMAIVRGKKTEETVPYREALKQKRSILTVGRGRNGTDRTLPKGATYLENDRRERKATGSYYTPDHIVKYIVEHAVGPVLQEHLEALRPKLREAQRAYREAQRRRAGFEKKGMRGDDPEKVANDERWRRLVGELFEFRVLDPAMGSGHFLVEAVDFLTDKMLDFLNGFPWNPVQAQLRQTRETILAEMERQGVTIDAAKLTDVNLLKRHALKRCIYGVDLNPMAVELAKVSLWLDCFTLGAPLSFLDHHLKVGNSLVGVTVEDVRKAVEHGLDGKEEQLSLFGSSQFAGVMLATDLMRHVGELSDVTAEQVQESRTEFRRASQELAPFKRVLDAYASRWFGNEPRRIGRGAAATLYDPTVEFLRSPIAESWLKGDDGPVQLSLEHESVARTARVAARAQCFFHWQLEFPEVFFAPRQGTTQVVELKSDPGFDAVVGNPPWVRQESISEQKAALEALLPGVYDSIADTYVYFIGRGLGVLRRGRRLGMVLPNKWLRADYGRAMRTFLNAEHQSLALVDFGHSPLFSDTDTFPCVLMAAANVPVDHKPLRYCLVPPAALPGLMLEDFVAQRSYDVPVVLLREESWILEPPEVAQLLDKICAKHRTLADIAPNSLYRGIIPGLTEAFFIDQQARDRLVSEDPTCEPLLRQVLRGRNIERWHPVWAGEWLILLKSSENHPWPWADASTGAERIFGRTYPALHRHLKPLQQALAKRQDQGRYWWELRSCSYYDALDRPKLLYQDMGYHSWFCFDDAGYFCNNTCYFLPTDDRWLTAIMNSSLMWWYLARLATHAKDEAFRLHTQFMGLLPIAEPSSSERDGLNEAVNELVQRTGEQQKVGREFFATLAANLGIERPPRKLEQFWRLDEAELGAELRRAAPRAVRLGAEARLAQEYAPFIAETRRLLAKILPLELNVQRRVFGLYGLAPEEITLLRTTAPPRDPLALAEAELRHIQRQPGGTP